MRAHLRTALWVGLLAASITPLSAQRVAERKNIWLGAGLGLGSARLSCTICRPERDGGTSGYLRFGATVNPNLLLGVESLIWYHTAGDLDFFLGSVQAVGLFYPARTSGLFFKGGLGIAQYSAKDPTDKVSTQALALQLGVGYEMMFRRAMSIVPFANFMGTTGGDVRFNDTVAGLSANTSLIQAGVGITLH